MIAASVQIGIHSYHPTVDLEQFRGHVIETGIAESTLLVESESLLTHDKIRQSGGGRRGQHRAGRQVDSSEQADVVKTAGYDGLCGKIRPVVIKKRLDMTPYTGDDPRARLIDSYP